MRYLRSIVALALAGGALVVACDDDPVTPPEITTFTAALNGANESPAVTTSAVGTATFDVLRGNIITYRVDVTGIDSAFASHIHLGAAGVNGPILVTLYGSAGTPIGFSGTLASGTAGAPTGMTLDSLLVLMKNGGVYVNVHTRANGAGAIRGQVVPR